MDYHDLILSFKFSLSQDNEIRRQAESKIFEFSKKENFLESCLNILSSNEHDLNSVMKQSIASFFKNIICKNWDSNKILISYKERQIIKLKILFVFIFCNYDIKKYLILAIRTLICSEFSNWKELFEITHELLFNNIVMSDESQKSNIYSGLIFFSEITRKFRWKSNRERENHLDTIIDKYFIQILKIGLSIVKNNLILSEIDAEMLKLILKCYKFVTYYDLPKPLRQIDTITSWNELFIYTINIDPPEYMCFSENINSLQISKCYKLSVANIYRLFHRYSSNNFSMMYNYENFRSIFLSKIIPPLINSLLNVIEKWRLQKKNLSEVILYYIIKIFNQCVIEDFTWYLIEPIFQNFIVDLIFPLLKDSDKNSYYHSNTFLKVTEYNETPECVALDFLKILCEKRKNEVLNFVLNFIDSQLLYSSQMEKELQETFESAKNKDAVFRMIGSVFDNFIINLNQRKQGEHFLINLLLPNINSKFDFLKFRALEVCVKFSQIKFQNESNLDFFLCYIIKCFNENFDKNSNFLICVQTGLIFQSFLHQPEFRDKFSNELLPIMSKLLKISSHLKIDVINLIIHDIIQWFPNKLEYFFEDLMNELIEQFLEIANHVYQSLNIYSDDFKNRYTDCNEEIKTGTCLLNNISSILLLFDISNKIFLKIEKKILSVIKFILLSRINDFMVEILDLIKLIILVTKNVSSNMWKIFELIYNSFTDDDYFIYIEEINHCLQNFLTYGQNSLFENPYSIDCFYKIIVLILEQKLIEMNPNEIVNTFKLIQYFILILKNQKNHYVISIVSKLLNFLNLSNENNQNFQNTSFCINFNNVVILSLLSNLNITFKVLNEYSYFTLFFINWNNNIINLKTKYDIKITVLGLIKLMEMFEFLNSVTSPFVVNFGHNLIITICNLLKFDRNLTINFSDNFYEFILNGKKKKKLDFQSDNNVTPLDYVDNDNEIYLHIKNFDPLKLNLLLKSVPDHDKNIFHNLILNQDFMQT